MNRLEHPRAPRPARRWSTSFTEKEIAPHLPQWEDAGELPRELHRKTAEAGLLGDRLPRGGRRLRRRHDRRDDRHRGDPGRPAGRRACSPACSRTASRLPHIIDSGNADLIDRYVRPTLAGEMIGSLGVTEPGGGSDVAGITTRAVRDGDDYVVNGAKTFITSGVRADFVTTAVRTGDDGLRRHQPARHRQGHARASPSARRLRKMGWHCSDTAELTFDDVRVPAANIVGEVDGGFVLIVQQFVSERLSLATQAYATAQRALDLAVAYARERETFGKPLIARQVIRHKLVEMHTRTAAARALTREAVERARRQRRSRPDADPRGRRRQEPVGRGLRVGRRPRPCRSSAAWATCASPRSTATTATPASSASAAAPPRS